MWVYSIYPPNYNQTVAGEPYCNKTVYLFAFWTTTLGYIILLLALLFGCFLCICACLFCYTTGVEAQHERVQRDEGADLLQLEQTTDSSGRRGTGPPTEPGFSQGFFSILSPMDFSFLAAVASGLLSWGHFISSKIIDLIALILLKLN